ncbi:MAG: GDSL-type esterase/lipase family protein [Bacteroidetes bacterium]|nr:GDSL-type esterase/lipase family protein [Bacteroidota bacterium]
MNKILRSRLTILLILFLLSFTSCIHRNPFRNDIHAFLEKDKIVAPAKNSILFIGSSSFTLWTTLETDFPGYPIINRGFGGSTIPDLTLYVNDIVIPYQPKQIFIYAGENDLSTPENAIAVEVLDRYKKLYQTIRTGLPNAEVVFISIKPCPSRWHLESVIVDANQKIEAYIKTQPKSIFLDVHHAMLLNDSTVNPDLFREGKLHMNEKGYDIWKKIIQLQLMH